MDPLGAYVVIREALANAAEHASGRNVTVRLSPNKDDMAVMVGDGGRRFIRDEAQGAGQDHDMGLEMPRPTVAEVGGRLRVESRQGWGTRVIAALPINGAS